MKYKYDLETLDSGEDVSYYFNLATLSSEVIYFFEGFIDVNVWQCNQTPRRVCVNLFTTIEREDNHKDRFNQKT